jgi:hypothetical protein
MAEFRRPSHARVARLLARMDGKFLARARCYFGGGTQLALAYGEYRESRDIDFVCWRKGIRMLKETVNPQSLGRIFKEPVTLVRELVSDRDAVRTYITEDPRAEPIKFEIVYEGRIEVGGSLDPTLGVPVLRPAHAVAEKLLANTDRGLDRVFRSRDVIDLAFISFDLSDETFRSGLELAQTVYGKAVLQQLSEVVRKLELDAGYRAQCIEDLLIEDSRKLRQGLARLRALKRSAARPRKERRV